MWSHLLCLGSVSVPRIDATCFTAILALDYHRRCCTWSVKTLSSTHGRHSIDCPPTVAKDIL